MATATDGLTQRERFVNYALAMRKRNEHYGPRFNAWLRENGLEAAWADRMAARLVRETPKDAAPNGKRQ